MSNNNISKITKEDLPKHLSNKLYLDGNNFKYINYTVLDVMKNLKSIKLGNNKFACDCESYELYRFVMQNRDIIEDINNITFNCNQHGTGESIQAVSINDKNEINNKNIFCTNYQHILSSIVLPIVLVLLVAGIIILIMLCNKKVILIKLYSNPITRNCFRPEKDDSEVPYDVFVSYAHQDEQYVEEVLVPGLEETKDIKYKCLVHVRDFIPGRNISEQIMEAVENSKRTLICLSKHFLASDWAQHEFDVAHHRKRVVIVVVGDLPSKNEMSSEFWQYISSNTYLSYKDKWFWEKLHYALPHGINSSSVGNQFSLTTVTGRVPFSCSSVRTTESNGTNGINLASDEYVLADENPPAITISKDNNTYDGNVQMKCLPNSSSPATSTSTMTPSPKPKKENAKCESFILPNDN